MNALLRLRSARARLTDLQSVYPEQSAAYANLIEMDIDPAISGIDYLLSIAP